MEECSGISEDLGGEGVHVCCWQCGDVVIDGVVITDIFIRGGGTAFGDNTLYRLYLEELVAFSAQQIQ